MARALSTSIDTGASLALSYGVAVVTGLPFWPVAGMITVMYYTVMTIAFGASPGGKAVEHIRHRLPAFFEVGASLHKSEV